MNPNKPSLLQTGFMKNFVTEMGKRNKYCLPYDFMSFLEIQTLQEGKHLRFVFLSCLSWFYIMLFRSFHFLTNDVNPFPFQAGKYYVHMRPIHVLIALSSAVMTWEFHILFATLDSFRNYICMSCIILIRCKDCLFSTEKCVSWNYERLRIHHGQDAAIRLAHPPRLSN